MISILLIILLPFLLFAQQKNGIKVVPVHTPDYFINASDPTWVNLSFSIPAAERIDKKIKVVLDSFDVPPFHFELGNYPVSEKGTLSIQLTDAQLQILRKPEWKRKIVGASFFDSDGKIVPGNTRFFIGSEPDPGCETPILVSDFNGTLTDMDECTQKTILDLINNSGVRLAIVSATGVAPKSTLSEWLPSSSFVTLVRSQSLASIVDEKAETIQRQIVASRGCVIGFTSEDPGREGLSAQKAGVPYFGVNIAESRIGAAQNLTKNWCELGELLKNTIADRRKRYYDSLPKVTPKTKTQSSSGG